MAKDINEVFAQRLLDYWKELNKPPPDPVELLQAELEKHEASEGTQVHGLGSAATESRGAFEVAGEAVRVMSLLSELIQAHTELKHPQTAVEIEADDRGSANKVKVELKKHTADQENPHNVTAEQVGLDPKQFARAEHYHPQVKGGKGGSGGGLTPAEKEIINYLIENGPNLYLIWGDEQVANGNFDILG